MKPFLMHSLYAVLISGATSFRDCSLEITRWKLKLEDTEVLHGPWQLRPFQESPTKFDCWSDANLSTTTFLM